ncbi:putative steroid monooxygenase [Phaeomoniella chlamydospora]|uniref:Putative steroid monooxygenase n=1 Tax=Phaeomoniella chlamydospora TaxID=158046 RepID=A0A0G2GAV7_PHACM|nr:putative steroid monooxygenase [Phaeomoniella chlamydospora]
MLTPDEQYCIVEEPLGHARPVRIVTIGAGASGINVARNVKEHMKNVEFQMYEKNSEIGGTWTENRYAAEKSGLIQFIKFQHKVVEAVWNESRGVWQFKIENLATGETFQDYAHFFINASGYLNNWKWPDIAGLQDFQGDLMHSASWKPGTELYDKSVAVIGCGSSGIQLVANIQPMVKHLTTFIRQPTWVTAGFGSKYAAPGGTNFNFTEEQKREFEENPKSYLEYRKAVEHELNCRFKMLHKDTPEQAAAMEFATNEMIKRLGGPNELSDFIIPKFSVGCRRPTPGQGYLEALVAPNVSVITGTEISHATSNGLVLSDGQIINVDVIICATGFDLSFRPRFPIIGRDEVSLAESWSERPTAYLSMTPADMPNYFMFLGPNAPVGHGSAIPIIEHLTKYMLKMIYKAQTEGYKSFVPLQDAIDEFVEHADTFLERMAWASKCRSWFKNGKETGPVTALHPGSRIHWFHLLGNIRHEDWEWKTVQRNRWAFLGNGFSVREGGGRDLTWYFDQPEEGYEGLIY